MPRESSFWFVFSFFRSLFLVLLSSTRCRDPPSFPPVCHEITCIAPNFCSPAFSDRRRKDQPKASPCQTTTASKHSCPFGSTPARNSPPTVFNLDLCTCASCSSPSNSTPGGHDHESCPPGRPLPSEQRGLFRSQPWRDNPTQYHSSLGNLHWSPPVGQYLVGHGH